MLLLIILLVVVVFHRLIIFLLFSPITFVVYYYKSRYGGRIPRDGRIVTKLVRGLYVIFHDLIEDLFLRWIGETHSHRVRMFCYRYIYKIDISNNAVIYSDCEIRDPGFLHIGKGSIIGNNSILDARAGLEIKDNVCLASNVSIWTMQHDYRDPEFRCMPGHFGPVVIEDRAWIGPNVIILHDVTIGEGAVVAAGAVVTKSIPPYTLVGGIPARKIGERPHTLTYEFEGRHRHFI